MVGCLRSVIVRRLSPVAAVLVVIACGNSSTQASHPKIVGGTAVVRMQGDWGDSIKPPTATNLNSNQIVAALYDRLVTENPDGKIIPYLAKTWKVTPTSITFTLRRDATCSDGTPVTPLVVANSIKYFTAASTHSQWLARAFGAGPYTVASDDASSSVTLTVGTPYNELIDGFGLAYAGILCPAGLDPSANFNAHSYGSGPFILQSASHGNQVSLQVHKGWKWGPNDTTAAASGFPDTLVLKVIDNETTAANLLATGGLDIANINGPDIVRLKNDKSLANIVATSFFPQPLFMNEAPGHPAADEVVRHALLQSVDPKAYNQAANAGFGVVSPSIFGQHADCYEDTSRLLPKTDPGAARSLLVADGYTAGSDGMLSKGGKPLSVDVLANPGQNSGPEYLVSQFNRAGISATLDRVDYGTFTVNFRSGKFDVVVATTNIPQPNPSNIVMYYSGVPGFQGGGNWPDIQDPQLTDLLGKAYSAPVDQACGYWHQFQEEVATKHHALGMAALQYQWFSKAFTFSTLVSIVEPSTIRRHA